MPHAGQELHGRCCRSGAVRRGPLNSLSWHVSLLWPGTGVGVGVVVVGFFCGWQGGNPCLALGGLNG